MTTLPPAAAPPRQRARRSAAREIERLARHTPCIRGARQDGESVIKLDVDLPYLACGPSPEEPVRRQGFRLAVFLPPRYPTEEPVVAFIAEALIFHPAISPRLATCCLGSSLWSPDLGLARFVILHLEAILGLIEIDTLDGLFIDQVCLDAAVYYRRLRESNGLPLARPRFSTEPLDASARTESSRCPESAAADSAAAAGPAAPAGTALVARGPTGRRRVRISRAEEGAAAVARCALAAPGWHDSLTTSGAASFRWLSRRLSSETDFGLELIDGAPAFRLERGSGARAGASGAASGETMLECFESLLRRLELPTLALADPEISKTVGRTVQASA